MTDTDLKAFADLVAPLADMLAGVSLDDPARAATRIEELAPFEGDLVQGVRDAMFAGADAGWLLPKDAGGVRFGRVAKDLHGLSVDAVWMDSAPGPRHVHPRGEIDLLFGESGTPRFDGHPPGWAVYGAGSEHVPAVTGGSMLILYFLPGGAIEWR